MYSVSLNWHCCVLRVNLNGALQHTQLITLMKSRRLLWDRPKRVSNAAQFKWRSNYFVSRLLVHNNFGTEEFQATHRTEHCKAREFISIDMSDSAGNSSEVPQMSQMNYVAEPLGLRIFRLTIYVVIFLLATVGNALVIFVVYKTRELHTGKYLSPSLKLSFTGKKTF